MALRKMFKTGHSPNEAVVTAYKYGVTRKKDKPADAKLTINEI